MPHYAHRAIVAWPMIQINVSPCTPSESPRARAPSSRYIAIAHASRYLGTFTLLVDHLRRPSV